jgi:predicted AAA+ superfamily ATPase
MIFIDEAQRVKDIGLTLKIAIDAMPEKQFIVTGSSSFDLANKINEPLTGRKYEFSLYPFSIEEISVNLDPLEKDRNLKNWLIYGMYPDVVKKPNKSLFVLDNLVRGSLYKDALEHQNLKHTEILDKLLQALAFQIGQEVSYNELATLLGVNKATVERYVKILEQSFIIYQLKPFSRNLRNELKKMRKIYFYDIGIRNALIKAYGPIDLRNDIGAVWENFILSERIKKNDNHLRYVKRYFWRTQQKQEIDYLEEENNKICAFEFKWKKEKFKTPKVFSETYPEAKIQLINHKNYKKFVM